MTLTRGQQQLGRPGCGILHNDHNRGVLGHERAERGEKSDSQTRLSVESLGSETYLGLMATKGRLISNPMISHWGTYGGANLNYRVKMHSSHQVCPDISYYSVLFIKPCF